MYHAPGSFRQAETGLLREPLYWIVESQPLSIPTGRMDSEEILAWVHPTRANCSSSFGRLGQGLGGRRKEKVLVPDDRQKKHMWLVPCLVYQWFLFHFACLAVSWERAYITVDVADEWCRACLSVLLPPALLKFFVLGRPTVQAGGSLQIMKSQCFGSGARLCQKAGHSCFRKIVSYMSSFPAWRCWRFIHRAPEAVVRLTGMGDEVWSLKDACVLMKEKAVPTNACAEACLCSLQLSQAPAPGPHGWCRSVLRGGASTWGYQCCPSCSWQVFAYVQETFCHGAS